MDIPVRNGILHEPIKGPYFPEFYGIVLPIIAVCGLILNLLCVAVFALKHMRSSSTAYLIALAIADCMVLITVCLVYTPRAWIWVTTGKDPDFEHPYPDIFVKSDPLFSISTAMVTIYTLEASVDQYLFVFKVKRLIWGF